MGMTIAAIAALGPFLLAQRVAQAFSIASRWYFIAAGALAGSLLSPFAVSVITNGEELMSPALLGLAAGTIIPGGAIGGFVYWLIDGRNLAGETRAAPHTISRTISAPAAP
jgi:hypothetical protein